MKKILSILMILVLVSGVVFAQDEASAGMPAPTFSGEATLSWGMDLGSGTDKKGDAKISHGFLNEASASVALAFVKAGGSKGDGDVYAYIDLSGVSLGLSADLKDAKATGKVGGVEAKIVFYGAYITIYNAPDMTTAFASSATSVIGDKDANWDTFKTGFEGFGTKIGYANKDIMDLDVGLKFVSNGSWKDRDSTKTVINWTEEKIANNGDTSTHNLYKKVDDDYVFVALAGTPLDKGKYYWINGTKVDSSKYKNAQYGFGLDFHMVPVEKYLTIDTAFNMTMVRSNGYQKVKSNKTDKYTIGFGLKLTSAPVEGLNLKLGFDGGMPYGPENKFAWALGFGTDYTNETVGTVDFGMYVSSDGTPYGNSTVAALNPPKTGGVDMAMTVGYSGLPLVEGLDIHTRLNVFRLLSKISQADKDNGKTIPLGFNFGVAYTAKITDSMSIKPYADIWGETNCDAYKDGTTGENYFGIAYELGVAFMPMERLTVKLNWAHGEHGDPTLGNGRLTPVQHKADNGKFVLSAKIAY